MKVNFDINSKTVVEFHGDEVEPEIAIRTGEDLIEIFGSKEDLKSFVNKLYQAVNETFIVKNCYVVNSENAYYWWDDKEKAKICIRELEEIHGQFDIRFTYSKCKINVNNEGKFEELEVIEVFEP